MTVAACNPDFRRRKSGFQAGRPSHEQNARRMRRAVSIAAVCLSMVLSSPGSAAAVAVAHTVAPGESLWSIAAANGLSARSLAAYNGLSEDAQLQLGTSIEVPSATGTTTPVAPDATSSATNAGSDQSAGSHVVRWGETLSGIAASAGVSADQLAQFNGLDPASPLLAGTVLRLPASSTGGLSAADARAETGGSSADPGPVATPERVTYDEIAQIAQAHGVPPSLAAAVAWQESGFNNAVVSSADARGVMQIIPGTWDFIRRELASQQLNAASARENVHAGVMLLAHLLRASGGDPAQALAAYYQGLESVRTRGVLPDTQRYVDTVMALRSRFGGP
jgi:N-acetylmuramoyl-L-alanine amidase